VQFMVALGTMRLFRIRSSHASFCHTVTSYTSLFLMDCFFAFLF
jgi:hypothetical protein